MDTFLEVRMQTIQYLELPESFDPKLPMSVQLRNERLKLFNNKKENIPVTTDHPLILEACKFLQKTLFEIVSKKSTRTTGRNYDLFAIVYYFRTRNICTLEYLRRYVFTNRNILNYRKHLPKLQSQQKYIDLFNYLDSIR
jgi:hypothetical protein